jgi:hypothetical protein
MALNCHQLGYRLIRIKYNEYKDHEFYFLRISAKIIKIFDNFLTLIRWSMFALATKLYKKKWHI